jgi:hypothetical protein
MSRNPLTTITNMGVERAFSVREAAALLGRSRSWLDQGVRAGQFTRTDGSVIQPLRTPGNYRVFTTEMVQDIATNCYRRGRLSRDALTQALCRMLAATGSFIPPE